MIALSHRIIAVFLIALLGNPLCCCGTASEGERGASRCCKPIDGNTDSSPEPPEGSGEGGCEGCLCCEEITNSNEPVRGVASAELGNLETILPKAPGTVRGSIAIDRRLLMAAVTCWHSTRVPIYQRDCAYLL